MQNCSSQMIRRSLIVEETIWILKSGFIIWYMFTNIKWWSLFRKSRRNIPRTISLPLFPLSLLPLSLSLSLSSLFSLHSTCLSPLSLHIISLLSLGMCVCVFVLSFHSNAFLVERINWKTLILIKKSISFVFLTGLSLLSQFVLFWINFTSDNLHAFNAKTANWTTQWEQQLKSEQ